MQTRNADMWLVEEAGAVHIHRLCGDQPLQGDDLSSDLACRNPQALKYTLSRCGQQMARLGAAAGQFLDQIARLSAASTMSPRHRFERGNSIAAVIDEVRIDLQRRFKSQILPSQHSLLIIVGLARVRRDISVLLCKNLQLDTNEAVEWAASAKHFHRRRLDLDRALVQCAVDHSGRVMLSLLGEPFLTNFIVDSAMVLASDVQRQWNEQGVVCRDTTIEDLKYSLLGRNLLVVISKQGELAENRNLAAKASQLLSQVVNQVFTISDATIALSSAVLDVKRIVSIDQLLSLADLLKFQSDAIPNLNDANAWLDWIASYPALQRIFDAPPSDISIMQQPFSQQDFQQVTID
jgi:hypothetical protein